MFHTFYFNQEKQTYFILRSQLATEYARKWYFILLFVDCLVWFNIFWPKKRLKKKGVEANILTTGELNLYVYCWEPKSGEK